MQRLGAETALREQLQAVAAKPEDLKAALRRVAHTEEQIRQRRERHARWTP
jgi:hypothetical protein